MIRTATLFSLLITVGPVFGGTINWGSEFGSVNVQSDSSIPVTAGFTVELGKFTTGFDPSGANVDLWAANWTVFDELLPGEHNAAFGYFTGELELLDNSVFAPGDQAYVWMFNNQTTVPGSEWLLYTNDSTDSIASDDWNFPAVPGSQQTMPLSWRVSNASRVVFGGFDPDRDGSAGPRQGDGHGTPPSGQFNLQTHTFVPEPSAGLLGGLAALIFLRRRRTRKHAGMTSALVAGASLILGATAVKAHNLDQQDTSIAFDGVTLNMMSARAGLNQPLVQAGDTLGLILKSTPGPGTLTGAGGYMTFYIPPGTQVVSAQYGRPDGSGGFLTLPMKGPSIMAIGDGSVGSAVTAALTGLSLGPNSAGVTAQAVNASGMHNGTLAGVYGDTGVFYSVDPDTVWQSFVASGGYDGNPGTSDNFLTNNRGEARVPITKWDAQQLIAFGLSNPAPPIVDPNGRGNAPWGMASAVAGPQSGYQWAFDRDYWVANPGDPNRMKNSIVTGPWQRIRHPGSTIAKDQPGLKSTALGFTIADAGNLGATVSPATPLPPTLSLADSSSPKAVRISYGGLVLGQSEFARVELKILAGAGEPGSPFDPSGCFSLYTDTFGGDAGGEQGGKDHLWRYYDPTVQALSPCASLQKQFAKTPLAPGETSHFDLTVMNTGTFAMNNVVITDPLPSGLVYVSAVPAPISTAPLTWNLGTVSSQGFVSIRVNYTATGTGTIFNTATMTSSAGTVNAMDSVDIGFRSLLDMTKSVTPSVAAPGATVTYTMMLSNAGTGPNGTPLLITDVLPSGFTYSGFVSAQINGTAASSGVVTVNAADTTRPVFTVSQGIQPGKALVISFTALVSSTQPAGTYGNALSLNYESKVITSGSLAPVTVGGGRIGDTIFRDWDGDGVMEFGEEGITGVTVELYDAAGAVLLNSTVTDAAGQYLFTGLAAGTLQVRVTPPAGYLQTADPDVTPDNRTSVTLALDQVMLTADFGYRYDPANPDAATIGDLIFSDDNNNHLQDGAEAGIPSVTVNLYEDTDNNGVVDTGDLLIGTMAAANGVTDDFDGDAEIDPQGFYLFGGMDPALRYVADVDAADPDIAAFFGADFQQSTPDRVAVSGLAPGGFFDTADFGFFGIEPASVGDQVFLDNNGDGLFDGGDAPLANVSMELFLDVNGNGVADPGELTGTAVTSASGIYSFPNLGPASYIVKVAASDPDIPAGTVGLVSRYSVTLAAGDNIKTADFPYVRNLTKTADKSVASSGENINYTISPYHPGSAPLTNVQVTDPVPADTTYNGSAAPVPSSEPAIGGTGNVGWNLGSTVAPAPGSGTTPSYTPNGRVVQATAELEDSFLDENNVTQNNGNNNSLRTRPEAGKRKVSLMRFTLPALAPTDVIDRAMVRVRVDAERTSNHTIALYRVTTPTAWVEASVNWNDPNGAAVGDWTSAGGVFGASDYDGSAPYASHPAPQSTGKELEFDVTDLVRAWRNGILPNNGVVLAASGIDKGDVTFFSSEGGTAGSEPGPRLALGISTPGMATNETLLDAFASTNYALNTGTKNWLGDWFETGDDGRPNGGNIRISSSRLQVSDKIAASIQRAADLAGANSATLSYNVTLNTLNSPLDQIAAEASNNAGTSWVRLATYTQGSAPGNRSFDLIAALGSVNAQTRIRFIRLANGGGTGKLVGFDDVGITFSTPAGPATGTSLTAGTALMTGTRDVTVTMTVISSTAATVTPPANLTTALTGGATAAKISGPTPATGTADASGADFTWVYQVTAGASPGSVRFSGQPTGPAGFSFGSASSQSVLVTPPLSFQVKVNTPAVSTFIPNTATVTDTGGLNAGASAITAIFASIGDLVWQDTNGDGTADSNGADNIPGTPDDEPGISGVRVYADSNGDGVFNGGEPSTLTDNAGAYRIYGFGPGTYTIRYDAATIPAGSLPTTPAFNTATLVAAQQYSNADFGLLAAAAGPAASSIGDTLWLDASEDGIVDSGEAPLPGVTVNLHLDANNNGGLDPGDLLVGSTATNAAGLYSFTPLNSGNYLVAVDETDPDLPAGLELVSGGANGAGLHDVTLGSGASYVNADFGYHFAGSIGDTLFYDPDSSQSQDPGEDGVPNGVVTLWQDVDHDGAITPGVDLIAATTSTDPAGFYLFDNLPPGDYVVKAEEQHVIVPPPGPNAGLYDRMVATTGTKLGVTLAPGQTYLNADFGFIEAAEVEGHVFHDINHNGLFDPGETPLGYVTVTLTGTDAGGNPVSMTGSTESDGEYKFLPPPGIYIIAYDTFDPDIPAGLGDHTTPDTLLVTLAAGQEYGGFDFGRDDTGSAGDTIFADANGNGSRDSGEPGLANVAVELYSDSGYTSLITTAVTDGDGHYLFNGLPDGTYYVQVNTVTLPAGYNPVPTADPDATADSRSTAITTGGGSDLTNDFGYRVIIPAFSVSGTVWHDNGAGGGTAANGVQDGTEPGIPSTTVTAGVDTDADGTPEQMFTAATTAAGGYVVAGIPQGSNILITVSSATLPSPGYGQTGDPDSTFDHQTTVINLAADVTGRDFGYREVFGSISGTVVTDAGGNGLADSGETPMAGVGITLRYAGPDGISGTADDIVQNQSTNGFGDYSFTALLPGLYEIVRGPVTGYHAQADRDGGNPEIIQLSLAPGDPFAGTGDVQMDQDFEIFTASLGDYVWFDRDGDGVQDPADTGLSGIHVYADTNGNGGYDSGEPEATTDITGAYHLSGLVPGTYTVRIELLPPGATPTFDADGTGTPNVAVVTVAANSERLDVDWGYRIPKATNWNAWQIQNPLGGGNGPNQNPEGDLYENLIEFAFCYDARNGVPKNPAGNRAFCLRQTGGGTFNAEIVRPAGFTGLTYTLQYSAELGTPTSWMDNNDSTGIVPGIVNNLNGFETVTWQNLETIPVLNEGAGYIRIKVTLAAPAATAFTEVQGWHDHGIATQCETYSNPFLKKEVFSGTVDIDSSEGELNVTGSSAGVDVSALLLSLDCPLIEITGGPFAGHRFAVDIEGGDADTISLMPGSVFNTIESFPDLSGAPFVLREPWRFNDLFPAATFQSGGDVNTADNILTFDSATQSWTTFYLANLGPFGVFWVDTADTGFPPASHNNRCLRPDEGIFVHRRGAPVTVPLAGIVRENDFACPLVPGYQLTGGGYPLDQSYADRGMTLAAGFNGDPDIRSADQVLFWTGDTTVGRVGYPAHYLLDAGAPYQRWVSAEDSFVTALDNSPVFTAGRAAFIRRTTPLPGYQVAAPWSP